MAQCLAKSKRTHEQCRHAAMHGRQHCYHHGGVTTTLGTANRHFKTGRYSKILPLRLAARYEEARTNPRLLSLSDDIATVEARLADLFQRVDSGESGHLWQALKMALDAFSLAMAAREVATMERHFATMRQLVQQGSDDHAAWAEIQTLWETRARLTQTETKTLLTLQQMVTTDQLMTYFGVITDTIQRAVTTHADTSSAQAILGEISAEFQRISVLEEEALR